MRRSAGDPTPDATRKIAASAKALLAAGDHDGARDQFDALVVQHQRRASRLALSYLRDRAEADEAVQDAFLKTYVALASYDERLSFDAWFTRILVNGCLDRLKARGRRARWMLSGGDGERERVPEPVAPGPSPEQDVLRREASRAVRDAIDGLPDRQRTVVLLTQLDGRATAEVSAITGLSEATVRVHLFRALRRLRQVMTRAASSPAPTTSDA